MSLINYTEDQKRAVELRRQDLLVHAGAGSGKTKVLVGRFYDLVTRDRLAPHQILAITFTEKAAQEMKDRLRRLFLEKNLGELARQVAHAYISTIHAFCSRLLRENALEARVDPAFTVLEEYEAYRLQKDFLREVLNRRALGKDENYLNFLLEVASPDLEKDLLKLYQQTRGKGLTQFSLVPASPAGKNHPLVINQILKDLDEIYRAHKDQQGWLDFADLELKAKKLLEEHQDLREELQKQWPHILLDELQDTNHLQLEILSLLRTPGQFFAVGDPHQSIYGFRFADLKAYEELQREVDRRGGKVLPLGDNFRSRPPLLQWVDYCFSPLWPKGSPSPHIQMKAGSNFAPKEIPSLEAIIFNSQTKEVGRNFEADAVCRRIYELVNQEKMPIYDKEQKLVRPLEFGDCAILLRKTNFIKIWEQALRKYNLPYQVVRSRGFFATPEVADLLNLLKALENPLDDLALASFLRSPLVGISEDTLLLLYQKSKSNGRPPFFFALDQGVAVADLLEEEKLTFARELLQRLRPLRPQGFYRLLKQGLAETYYPAKSYLYPQGERIRANLHKLAQVVYEMSGRGSEHLRDLLEVADFLRYQKDEIAEGEVAAQQKGCLSLSTIHSAKGLEFPLVAVAELDSHLKSDSSVLFLTKDHRVAVKIKDPATGKSLPLDSPLEKEKAEAREEELRLLYVAFTRAQEHLLLSGSLRFNKDGSLHKQQWIYLLEDKVPLIAPLKKAGEAGQEIATPGEVPVRLHWQTLSGQEPNPLAEAVRAIHELPLPEKAIPAREWSKEIEQQGQALLAQVEKAQAPPDGSHYLVSVTEVVDFYCCPRLYQLKYLWGLKGDLWEEGAGFGPEEYRQDGWGGSGRDLGSFMHQLLARPEISAIGGAGVIQELPLPIPDALKGEAAKIRRMLNNFAQSPWKSVMERAQRVERELPLVVKVGAYSNTPLLLQGRVDALIFDDPRNYTLIDYKTGKAPEDEKSYQLQLQLYALALAKIYRIPPQKAVLYYLQEEISQEVPLENKALNAAENWVEKLFEAQKRQEFLHKNEYCNYCRQRRRCEEIRQ